MNPDITRKIYDILSKTSCRQEALIRTDSVASHIEPICFADGTCFYADDPGIIP